MNLEKAARKLNEAAPEGERLIYANPLEEAMLKSAGGSGKPSSGGVPSYKKGDVDMPPQQSYGDSMRESLQAQVDLAPQLYASEMNQAYGRPAYARGERAMLWESLLGNQAPQGYQAGDIRHPQYSIPQPTQPTGGGGGGKGGVDAPPQAGMNPLLGPPVAMMGGIMNMKRGGGAGQGTGYGRGGGGLQDMAYTSGGAQGGAYGGGGGQGGTGGLLELMGAPAREYERGMGVHRPGFDRSGRFGGLGQYGADLAQYGATRQRGADIGDVYDMAPAAREAFERSDPKAFELMDKMTQGAMGELGEAGSGKFDPMLTMMRQQAQGELGQGGYGGLLGMMSEQAEEDLAARDSLTARESSRAMQDARQAAEARGRQFDPSAMVGELEQLEGARRARRAERRGFAGTVMAAQEARKAAGRQYGANVLAMEQARRGEARGYGQQMLAARKAMSADPFMAILGRPSGAGQQIAQHGYGASQGSLGAGPGVVFNPEAGLSYMLGQQANQANLAAAKAGAGGAMGAGMMGMMGSLGAAGIAACWVAREVYGESNPKWKQFRSWVLNKAPDWFREWYLINGESVAEHIKDKPEMKARIKIFMDSKLEA